MALTGRQEEAAALVAAGLLTLDQIADQIGVVRKTVFNWRQLPAFTARVDELRTEYRAAIRERGIAIMEHRVDRLQGTWDALKKVVRERAEQYQDHELPEARSGYYVRQVKLVKVYEAGELVPTDSHDELDGQPHGGALKRKRKDPLPDLSIRELLETGKLPESMQDIDFEVEDHKGGVLYSAKKNVEVIEWALEASLLKALNDIEKQAAIELHQWQEKTETTHVGAVTIRTITAVQPALPAPESDER